MTDARDAVLQLLGIVLFVHGLTSLVRYTRVPVAKFPPSAWFAVFANACFALAGGLMLT